MKPPDLKAPGIEFPIHIPIRIRHFKKITKPIYQ